ncbi:TPM domain-containing protein [Paenibacillus sp. MER TA 81-3]|uniref:TPM domain-containing protein n=1 Tax=Paenibacillus sp. MER TA 81-3 TaxID=2939573 RepID=UPI00203C8DB5|nr:TPM domain-containing protein [Paenibacillus sp. MER TA 81-3]MCM3342098.1 TPM domain-containing protein [Paenibacillus sp. MER TA 81-3]
MRRKRVILAVLFFFVMMLAVPMDMIAGEAAATKEKQLIFDTAELLNQQEYDELNALANQYGAERETDMMIVTINSPEAYDVKKMTQDFYDDYAPGYDKPHGNAVILMLDMTHRDVYLAGFYKAKTYLDDERFDKIRDKITPDLTSGDYKLAFQKYIQTAHKYMGFRPGVNPDNIFFNTWVQLGIALALGGGIATLMVRRSGGRITVNSRTYEDASTSGVMDYEDTYLHTSTTKRKIERSSSSGSSGGGGGGGTTSGGHSHSGSRGSF